MKNLRIKTLPLLVAAVLCHLSASVRAETECPLGDASARSAIMELCPFKSGLARIEIGHRWGFVNADGKLVIAPQFDAVQDFSEGVAAAQVDEKWGLIDRQGKWIVAPAFDDVQPFSGGLAAAHKDGKYGYIDPTGKWIIAPTYADAGNFSGPVAVVRENYPRAMLIDKQGRVVKRFAADVRVQDYGAHEGRFVASIEPAPLLLHIDGRTLPMPEGAASHGYQAEHFIASKQERRGEDTVTLYGLVDVHGKWAVPAIYNKLEEFNGKLAIASLDGHLHGLVNKSGKMVTAPRYKRIKRQEDGRYVAERANQADKTDLLDENGKFLFALDCGDIAGEASIGTLRILSGCQRQWLVHVRDGIIASHEGEREITVRGKHVLILEKNTDELRPALRFDIYNDAGKRVGGSDSASGTEQGFNTVGLPAGKSARRPDYALPLAIYGKFSDNVSLLTHDYQLITRPDWRYDSALLEYLYSDDKDEFEGPLVMKGEDGFGAVDAKGNWLIQPRYRTLSSFKHGLAIASTDEDTVLIDATGKTYPFPDEGVRFTRAAYMVVEGESDAGIVSIDLRTGERTTREALEYGYDNPLADGLRATKKDEKWGITDDTARWVLAPAYDRAPKPVLHGKKLLGWISEVDMPGSDSGDYLHGLLDRNGRELIKPRFTSLKSDDKTGLLLAAQTNGRQSVLNANGKVVIKPVLASLTSLGDGWFSAEMSHLHGLIDQRGEWLLKPDRFAVQLDQCSPCGRTGR